MANSARNKITLACTECKQRNYDNMKNKGTQESNVLSGIFQQGLLGASAIRDAGRIAEIDQLFFRQDLPQRLHRRQPSQAGIEYPDGPVVHAAPPF